MTPTEERGRWFRVYARQVEEHAKFRDLSGVELGAWTALRAAAELRDRAIIRDRAEALLILRRRRIPRPATVLDGLIARRLFDVDKAGSLSVHDRADHDRPKYPSDDPEEVRRRKAEERARKQATEHASRVSHEDVTTRDENSHDTHARVQPQPQHSETDAEAAPAPDAGEGTNDLIPEGWDAPDAVVAYHSTTGRYPSEGVIEWLNRLSNDHPEEAIARVIAEQYTANNNLGTLLSRTDAALKLDQHRRTNADERARAKAQALAEVPHRQKEREATPEEKEQAALQRQAIRLGLQRGLAVPTDPDDVRKFVMKHAASA